MRSPSLRRPCRLGSLIILGLGLAAPAVLHAAPKVVAHPGPPSSVSALYGRAVPNPFRSGGSLIVTVPFVLAGAESPRVTIHDARGRLVRKFATPGAVSSSGGSQGGFQEVTWDGRDGAGRIVPSGVYFMALEGEGLSDAKRIVVLR